MKQLSEKMVLFLRGILMGLADTVPGVSGGTIAFITGIYPRLIAALRNATKLKIDWNFFIPLVAGIGLAIIAFSKVVGILLESHTAMTFAFFFGLIAASAFVLRKKIGRVTMQSALFLALGFVVAYFISGASSIVGNHSSPFLFVSGMVAISAMLLPGISGAFILLLLGQYEFLIAALHSLNFAVIATVGAGALAGLAVFSHAVSYLLKKFKKYTLAFLIGLMVGSLRVPVLRIAQAGGVDFLGVLLGLVGFLLVFWIESSFKEVKVV